MERERIDFVILVENKWNLVLMIQVRFGSSESMKGEFV